MQNVTLSIQLVDGSSMPFDGDTGQELIEGVFGDDWAAPPKGLRIDATAPDGKQVVIWIPYGNSDTARVTVEDGNP